ncbi:MAG: large conductance mechanosensitive channel protein MscL [Clostridia bacterium]|nr:large conductance mechanosensitive channel protein MscL [Clostridia bacterium]
MAKKSSFFKDFKNFISKGNILDMAVGVIIGGAFGKIVASLVADVISPLISLAMGGVSLSECFAVISNPNNVPVPETATAAVEAGINVMRWGNFLQTIIDFLIIALCIFLFLRIIIKTKEKLNAKKKAEEDKKAAEEKAKKEAEEAEAKAAAEAAEARKTELEESALKQEKLLAEIRDLLAKK